MAGLLRCVYIYAYMALELWDAGVLARQRDEQQLMDEQLAWYKHSTR
jgi:hypothetical protein